MEHLGQRQLRNDSDRTYRVMTSWRWHHPFLYFVLLHHHHRQGVISDTDWHRHSLSFLSFRRLFSIHFVQYIYVHRLSGNEMMHNILVFVLMRTQVTNTQNDIYLALHVLQLDTKMLISNICDFIDNY